MALSVGSGALVAGASITPAAADCHGGPLVTLANDPVNLRRQRRLARRATPPSPSADTLKKAIAELPSNGDGESLNEDERGWLSSLFETLDQALGYATDAVNDAFNHAEELYMDTRDSIGSVARTIAATLVDEFQYLRDNLKGILREFSLADYIGWIATNVHRAINGILSAAGLLRALQMPVTPWMLIL
ncbi:MAG: hypothetical protein OXI81_10810, partial [Paracoccaceae bacterium]|nr:hypothetical protein [Paracoccaceae bacterium]